MIKPRQHILAPLAKIRSGQAQSRANSRAVVVARGGQAQAGVPDALFVHMGADSAPTGGSMGFVAQHLDQEWVHRKPYTDPRKAVRAYRRARNLRIQRLDLLPLI
jgi:hypothetical protein